MLKRRPFLKLIAAIIGLGVIGPKVIAEPEPAATEAVATGVGVRKSGRTTRMLLRALAQAGDVPEVHVIAATEHHARILRVRFLDLAILVEIPVFCARKGTGAVNVGGTEYYFRRIDSGSCLVGRSGPVHHDHYALEMLERQQLPRYFSILPKETPNAEG